MVKTNLRLGKTHGLAAVIHIKLFHPYVCQLDRHSLASPVYVLQGACKT